MLKPEPAVRKILCFRSLRMHPVLSHVSTQAPC